MGAARITPEKMAAVLTTRGFSPRDAWPSKHSEKVWWTCSEGHEWAALYSSLQQGKGCPHCSGNAPVTPEKMAAVLTPRGFSPRDAWPSKHSEKVWWTCSKGHEWAARYNHLQQGTGCPHCAGVSPQTPEKMAAVLTPRGFNPRDAWPSKHSEKVWWTCSEGHEWRAVYNSLQQGKGCPHCAGVSPLTPEKMAAVLTPRGLSPRDAWPSNVREKVWWTCSEGHEWVTLYNNLKQGTGCPHCSRDQRQPNGIYHLAHGDFDYQYVGISYKPKHRLKQHQEDGGPRGELARTLKVPHEFTVEEIYNTLIDSNLPDEVSKWFSENPFGRTEYGQTVYDTPWENLPVKLKAKAARVPRFVAEWIETELIQQLSVNFPDPNPFIMASKHLLVNIAKNSGQTQIPP
jgi:hypothetical protein